MTDADRARGGALRRARELRGLSQNQVGKAAGLDVKTVQRLEAGTVSPNLTTFLSLADLYEQSLDALAGRAPLDERPTPPAAASAGTAARSLEAPLADEWTVRAIRILASSLVTALEATRDGRADRRTLESAIADLRSLAQPDRGAG